MIGPWSPQSHSTDVRSGRSYEEPGPAPAVRRFLADGRGTATDRAVQEHHRRGRRLPCLHARLRVRARPCPQLPLLAGVGDGRPDASAVPARRLPSETWGEICQAYSDELAKLEARAERHGVTKVTSECRQGIVVDQILRYLAQHPSDLLIVGARGLSASRRVVLGSVSDALVHDAACPVLVVREYVVKPGT